MEPNQHKKNGQKIIIELKNKLGAKGDIDLSEGDVEQDDLFMALKKFGYSAAESQSAIQSLKGAGESLEDRVRLALKFLGK